MYKNSLVIGKTESESQFPKFLRFEFAHNNNEHGGPFWYQGRDVYYDADAVIEVTDIYEDMDGINYHVEYIDLTNLYIAYDEDAEMQYAGKVSDVDPALIREIERHILSNADISGMINEIIADPAVRV